VLTTESPQTKSTAEAVENLYALHRRLNELRSEHGNIFALHGKIGRCDTVAMIDSGATANFVSREFVIKNKIPTRHAEGGPSVQLADGTSYQCSEAIENCALKIGPFQDRVHAYVFPLTRFDLILGTPWLSKHDPEISWRTGELKLTTPEGPLILKAHHDYQTQEGGLLSSMQFSRAIQSGEETLLCLLRPPKNHPTTRPATLKLWQRTMLPYSSCLRSSRTSSQRSFLLVCRRGVLWTTKSSWSLVMCLPVGPRTA
jgi:hypothetical protein